MKYQEEINKIFRTAIRCNICFPRGGTLQRSFIDVAQPRLIGKNYWSSPVRVLVMMINPGKGRDDENHRQGASDIRSFAAGQQLIDPIFENQRKDLGNWGKFMPFFRDRLGLTIDDLALANVAWCSTSGDKYPGWMLNECFARHTAPLVKLLDPAVILLSGSNVHRFQKQLEDAVPRVRVILSPHYAHRESSEYEASHARRIRSELETIVAARGPERG